jgi:hypothetical protein
MEIVGGGNVIELGLADELHHESDGNEHWQDSVVLCWWDLKAGVGGYHRIGQHPHHRDGARAHLTNNFFAKDCVYKRCEFISLRPKDVAPTLFGCGDDTCRFEFTDHAIWTFDQPEVSGQLHVHDFHPPVDIYPKHGQLGQQITAGHLEVGGRITGTLLLNGTRHQIDGLAFRDHGWGKRMWDLFVNHRWVAATFGPEMTLLALSVHTSDDNIANFGCVIRDNKLTYTKNVDILTYLEHDGITHRGGHVRMELSTGEVIECEMVPLQKGVVSWMVDQMAVTDTMCRITCGDRVGICDFEISTNPTRGTVRPRVAINGVIEDGLHRF